VTNYYQTRAQDVEDMRATLKHSDPGDVNLSDIRDRLGPIVADMEMIASLRRPDSLKLERLDDGLARVTVEMVVDESEASDMIRKLWSD
jgi:hypothetical protein